MFRNGLLISAQPLQQPGAGAFRVGHRFLGREGFGGNDEQGFRRVEVVGCFHEINAVHVGDETERQAAVAIMFERFVGHDRAKVRAANADVDNVLDALTGVASPQTAADAF